MKKRNVLLLALIVLMLVLASAAYANVELNYFIAEYTNGSVGLEWQSASETDSAGFNLWRSEENLPIVEGQIDTSSESVVKINDQPILNPDGSCGIAGHTYMETDPLDNADQQVYYYYLESIACSSGSSFYGDEGNGLMIEIEVEHQLLLPTVLR